MINISIIVKPALALRVVLRRFIVLPFALSDGELRCELAPRLTLRQHERFHFVAANPMKSKELGASSEWDKKTLETRIER